MRLVRFDAGDGPRLGAVRGEAVTDLSAAGPACSSMLSLIASGADGLCEVQAIVEARPETLPLEGVRLLAPIERPGKYLAIGMNYAKHAEEADRLGVARSKHQVWFNKQTTCVSGPFDDIDPGVTEKLDYEVELAVVIGRRAKAVSREDALAYVFGYTVANDVSARDWQFHSPTFTLGKSFDTHGPIGPWIVTADEVDNPQDLALHCWVNGSLRQSSRTSAMIHTISDQISYLSQAFTLEPGDLLATGTPEGVGVAMAPPSFLQEGDIVRCEIQDVGAIENAVRRRPAEAVSSLHAP